MQKITSDLMIKYAQTLEPSTNRAQCYHIADLTLGKRTIAQALLDDHVTWDHAVRHASTLMIPAGAAKKVSDDYGDIEFLDKSNFKQFIDF